MLVLYYFYLFAAKIARFFQMSIAFVLNSISNKLINIDTKVCLLFYIIYA